MYARVYTHRVPGRACCNCGRTFRQDDVSIEVSEGPTKLGYLCQTCLKSLVEAAKDVEIKAHYG